MKITASVRTFLSPGLVATIVVTMGCASADRESTPAPAPDEPSMSITGSLVLRGGMAPPRGSVARIAVTDFAAGAGAPAVASTSIDLAGTETIIPFELSVPLSVMEPGGQYAVLGRVEDSLGETLWTTTMAQMIDRASTSSDVGALLLSPLHPTESPDPAAVRFHCGESLVVARFHGEHLELDIDERRYELRRTTSGSGARYETDSEEAHVLFWNKGDSAHLEVDDAAYPECRKTP